MREATEALCNFIEKASMPDPIRFEVNGTRFTVWRISAGWAWSGPDGDQEDCGIAPFETAAECQQSAIWFAGRAA